MSKNLFLSLEILTTLHAAVAISCSTIKKNSSGISGGLHSGMPKKLYI